MTFRWRANGCPIWLRYVSVQVYCNEYGKIMREVVIKAAYSVTMNIFRKFLFSF